MGAITYYDPPHSGDRPLTGEIWSPGPRKRTLWVRAEDGTWVVVSLDKCTVVAPLKDPRFTPCPGHLRYNTGNKANPWTLMPSAGVRLDCPDCGPTARQEYVRLFRVDRRDFTQAEWRRCIALFEASA